MKYLILLTLIGCFQHNEIIDLGNVRMDGAMKFCFNYSGLNNKQCISKLDKYRCYVFGNLKPKGC